MRALTPPIIGPQHRRLGTTRRCLALMGAAALAAPILFAGPAQAAPAITSCRTAGHPATSAELEAGSEATLANVSGNLAWLREQFDQTTTASPAAWRVREELDRLGEEAKVLDQLRYVAFVRGDATLGSPAQFRAQEELDSLCNRIGV